MNARSIRVLVLDDDAPFRQVLKTELERMDLTVCAVDTPDQARAELAKIFYPVMLLDLNLAEGVHGADFVPEIARLSPETAVIALTGHATIESAVQLLKSGVFDYKTKPCPLDELESSVRRAAESVFLKRDNRALREAIARPRSTPRLAGQSAAIRNIHRDIDRAAAQDVPVLVTGESGTGKEVVARLIHDRSARSTAPFVTVDAGTLTQTLAEAELFGNRKGAYTGADRDREGLVASAEGGTLFFDEIGELPIAIQPKLLRFMETREYRRLGDTQIRFANIRVIAATNRDLKKMCGDGTFREDLFFRLNVFPIELPPVRDRIDDLDEIVPHLAGMSAVRRADLPKFRPDALVAMKHHAWPGNVREIRNIIDRLLMTAGDEISAKDVEDTIGVSKSRGPVSESSPGLKTLEQSEADHIRHVLEFHGGDKKKTAETLGISLKTLYNKINTLKL